MRSVRRIRQQTVYFDPDLHSRIEAAAVADRRDFSSTVNLIVEAGLHQFEDRLSQFGRSRHGRRERHTNFNR